MSALEPMIGERTMRLHYEEILLSFIDRLNILLDAEPHLRKLPPLALLSSQKLPRRDAEEIRYTAGAVYAHTLYFRSMRPYIGGEPSLPREIAEGLARDIGSFGSLAYSISSAAYAMREAGFLWLLHDRHRDRYLICPRSGYDIPDPMRYAPILCIDLFEHAYLFDVGARKEDAVRGYLALAAWRISEE